MTAVVAKHLAPAPSLPLPELVAAAWPAREWRDLHVLVAVSGGPDSSALLHVLCELKGRAGGSGRLVVGHVNHGLRGRESDADEAWVVDECRRLDVECVVRREDAADGAVKQGDGVEAAARDARYRLLAEMAEETGARFVATGHTHDDQVETILFRLLRGTGLRGLAGMPAARPLSPAVTLVRPLLAAKRDAVVDYLGQLGQGYRVDATNADRRFARNRIRHEVLPYLRAHGGADVDESLLELAAQAAEAQRMIERVAAPLLDECRAAARAGASNVEVELSTAPLARESESIICEVLRLAWRDARLPEQAMTREKWRELAALAKDSASPALNLPGALRARRVGDALRIELAS